MKKWICHVVGLAILISLLSSCSASKSLKKSHSIAGMSEREYLENVVACSGKRDALTGKMAMSIHLAGKQVTKVNGTLRIKKGKVIQLSITPLLGIEVARAEFTPEGVLIIDRLNKRYVEASFGEIKSFSNAGLDFLSLQALFLNELFLPGKAGLSTFDTSAFDMELEVDRVVLNVKKRKLFNYQFYTGFPDAFLKETCIGLVGTPYLLRWKYDDFRKLGLTYFPSDMLVTFEGGEKAVQATLNFSRMSMDADWETHTEVSKKYKRVELEDILKLLVKE